MEIDGYIVWHPDDLVAVYGSGIHSCREHAIAAFLNWQIKHRGYKPWQTWLNRGYSIKRVKLIIQDDE